MKSPLLFAIATALFWGLYGPALGQARAGLGSPFKPYVAIGVAYLIWGILGGVAGMWYKGDSFAFSGPGSLWGFAAGSLGAWGALTLTLAMFSGGTAMPHIVMPIVFGGAVTVSALVPVLTAKGPSQVSPWLWIGIAAIATGIVLVAYNTPHAPPHRQPEVTSSSGSGQDDRPIGVPSEADV